MTARPSAQRLTLAVAFFFLVLSFALYAFAPDDYSLGYCAAVLAVFLASTAWFIKKSLFGNYFIERRINKATFKVKKGEDPIDGCNRAEAAESPSPRGSLWTARP